MLRSPRVEVAVHKSRASVTAFPWHPHAANFEQREGVVLRSASLQVPDSSAHPLIILNLPHNLTDKLPRGPTPPSMEERNSGSKTLEDSNKRKRTATISETNTHTAMRNTKQAIEMRTPDKYMRDFFANETLEPSDLIPAHSHIDYPGKDWVDETKPPPGHVPKARGGKGAWRCKRQHACGDIYNTSERATCGGCTGEKTSVDTMDWDIPYDKNRGCGYRIFHKNTGFVQTMSAKSFANASRRDSGRHRNGKACRMRLLLRREFPEYSSEDLRPYWSRPFQWTTEEATDVERLMGVIRQEVQAGTWADDATTKRSRRNNKSAKNSTAASSSANLAEDTEQEEDEEEELETDEEEDEKSAGRSSPVQDVPLLGRSHAEKLSKSKQPTSTENLNADEEPEDDDEKITMKEEPTPGPSLLESTVAPPVVPLDVPASIMSAVTLFMSAAQKTDFEQHVIAMEDKLEYNNLAPVLENAHLLRFLLALFTYHARIFDPRTPEGYGCRIDYILVDRVRHYMEEVGTGDLGALAEVVIAEGEYERPALRRRLDRLMKKR
jgi:hypothetical protein